MNLARTTLATALLTASIALPVASGRAAEIAKDTLVIVSEMGPNGLDTMVPTANDHSRMVVWQAYDRLVSHGEKTLAGGTISYDAKVVTPELAESWEASEDGKTYIFHLRKDATFQEASCVVENSSFDQPARREQSGSLRNPSSRPSQSKRFRRSSRRLTRSRSAAPGLRPTASRWAPAPWASIIIRTRRHSV